MILFLQNRKAENGAVTYSCNILGSLFLVRSKPPNIFINPQRMHFDTSGFFIQNTENLEISQNLPMFFNFELQFSKIFSVFDTLSLNFRTKPLLDIENLFNVISDFYYRVIETYCTCKPQHPTAFIIEALCITSTGMFFSFALKTRSLCVVAL